MFTFVPCLLCLNHRAMYFNEHKQFGSFSYLKYHNFHFWERVSNIHVMSYVLFFFTQCLSIKCPGARKNILFPSLSFHLPTYNNSPFYSCFWLSDLLHLDPHPWLSVGGKIPSSLHKSRWCTLNIKRNEDPSTYRLRRKQLPTHSSLSTDWR